MIHRCALLWLACIFFTVLMFMTLALVLMYNGTEGSNYRPSFFPIWHLVETDKGPISLITYDNDYVLANFVFFISGIALVIYRLFRRNIFTVISHGLMHLTVLYTLVYRIFMRFDNAEMNFLNAFSIPYYFLVGCYTTQCTLAVFLVLFHQSRTHKVRKACRKFHAFLGLITYAVMTWNFSVHSSKLSVNYAYVMKPHIFTEPWIFLLLGQVFVLLVFFVLFMPIYEKVRNKRAVVENIEIPHTKNRGTQPYVVTKPFPEEV